MNAMFEPPVAYSPAFLARVRSRAPAVEPVQVVFSGADAEMLRAEAEQRNVTPMVLAKALMAKLRTDELVDAVMDGAHPQHCAGGHARGVEGLTLLQEAVLSVVAVHRDDDGVCRLSQDKIGIICADAAQSSVGVALAALRRGELIQRDGAEKDPRRPAWRLTISGRQMFERLMGDAE